MDLLLGQTTYPGGGPTVNTRTSPYLNPSVGGLGNLFGLDFAKLLALKHALAMRQQQPTPQAAPSTPAATSNYIQQPTPNDRLRGTQPTPLFTVNNPGGAGYTGGRSVWYPGMPLGPGQLPQAAGYLPQGYSAPTGPNNSSFNYGSAAQQATGLAAMHQEQEAADKAEEARRQLLQLNDSEPAYTKPGGNYY